MRLLDAILLSSLLMTASAAAQEKSGQEMTKDQWQQEINRLTGERNDATARMKALTAQADSLQALSTRRDDDYQRCLDELYGLVGSNASEADAFRKEIDDAERQAGDLAGLADADLMNRSADVDSLASRVDGLWKNRLSVIPEFYDRLTQLNDRVKALQTTVGGQVKTYTVGTWARNRDCLWNIAKKPDIYNSPWQWPKIWQGNRDQIRDPDVIHPGQKLKIPKSGELTSEERAAARKYYSRKHAASGQ